jgi:hypothetical protein
VSWILRLVKTSAEGEGQAMDVMEIDRPDDLRDVAALGLTLSEAKQLLSILQREIVAAQAGTHASVVHGSDGWGQQSLTRLRSDNAGVVRVSQGQHVVEDIDRYVDFCHPTFVYT